MASQPKPRLTIPEYLALERQAETKSDYHKGEMIAMSGASREHNRISLKVASAFERQLEDGPCEAYVSDMRVRVSADLFTYPDVVVVCGEPLFEDSWTDTLLNPTLIVEVLSESTERYDRRVKLPQYQALPSLSEILLIAQDRCHVDHLVRQADGDWLWLEIEDLEKALELPSIGCRLELARIYRRVIGPPRLVEA